MDLDELDRVVPDSSVEEEQIASGEAADNGDPQGFFNRKIFKDGWMTPGLALLLITALFAIYKIVDVVLYFTR